jgi:ribosome-binding ATPase
MQCGLVGLPNAGKSTLFNALTTLSVPAEKYPFCTVEPNIGVVTLQDPRLVQAANAAGCRRITQAWVRFVDIAGLVEGASRGEGLGNKFLGHIREMDAIIHVVRGFSSGDVAHPLGHVDPLRDMELINTELYLADLETVHKQISKSSKLVKTGDPGVKDQLACLEDMKESLEKGLRPRGPEQEQLARQMNLLSQKPRLYVLNVAEDELQPESAAVQKVRAYAKEEGSRVLALAAALEDEIGKLPPEEQKEMRQAYGLEEEGLVRFVREAYLLLNLITFFTVKGQEARAWTVPDHTPARQGAGKVHSDMEKGFIKAEVIPWSLLVEAASLSKAREKGWVRGEGKDYPLQDGDVVLFHFRG